MALGQKSIRVVGLDRVLQNLDKKIDRILFLTKRGLTKGGLLILAESNRTVPRDLSNLAASGYVTSTGFPATGGKEAAKFEGEDGTFLAQQHGQQISIAKGSLSSKKTKPEVEVGYTAFYALFVHEDTQVAHKKGKRAKFLEKSVDENQSAILNAIASEAGK